MSNVAELLVRAVERGGDQPALIMPDGVAVTFRELEDRSGRFAEGLRRAGFGVGERALVMIPMSIELYVVLVGVQRAGGVCVFVDPWVGRRQIANLAAAAGATAFLGIGKSHLLRWSDARLRRIRTTVTTGSRWAGLAARHTVAALERTERKAEIEPRRESDSALITFTTGSTGEPKGADRQHGFLAAQHAALQAEFPSSTSDVDMPMFPVFALNNLAAGVPSVVPAMDFRRVDAVDGGKIAQQMLAHGVTTCTASPPFLDALAKAVRDGTQPAPTLRRILGGGAPVSDRQLRAWREAFPNTEVVVVYGSTEAEPVAHIGAEERLALTESASDHVGYCVGRPVDAVRANVIEITADPVSRSPGARAPAHQIGELIVSGDHVCRSYYRNERAVRQNKIQAEDGAVWHRMGDTGYFDDAGRFWLVGRVHSTIRRAGGFVHPQVVERTVAAALPAARRVAVVGIPGGDASEVTVGLLVQTADGDPKAVRQEAEACVREGGLPVDEVVVTHRELPVDPRHASKIDYDEIRARWSEYRA